MTIDCAMNVIVNFVRFVEWPDMDINLIKDGPVLAALAESSNDTE